MLSSLVDHVYVLTLKEKGNESMRSYFENLFSNRLTFFEVEGKQKSSNGGHINTSLWKILRHSEMDDTALDITNNHYRMMIDAHNKGYQCVLFLEDDARFMPLSPIKEERFTKWLQKHDKKWDVFYFGYCPWPSILSFFVTRDIVRLWTPLTCHSYMLNRRGMEKVIMYLEKEHHRHDHIDNIVTKIPNFGKYALFPMICFQERDPALYTKACDHLGISLSFTTLSRVMEWTAVIIPMIFLILCITIVYQKLI